MHVDDGWTNERKKELTVRVIFPLLYFALLFAALHFIIGANLLWYKINNDNNKKKVDTAPIKQGISDSMKAKLMAEASTGLDSEKPQTNVILYISVVVVILVALAGGGILY
tara:strand:+ start:134 stop:466 length:333 start_codon:yes stop_codon:yes gene_type:complete